MRLTVVLRQINYHRHFQRIWKRQGKMPVQELLIPPELKEMGVEIKDACDILSETKMFLDSPSVKVIPKPPSALEQGKYFYLMHGKVRVSENENQTLALTKTVKYEGLPEQLNKLVGLDSLPNQDELVQNSVLQAQVWDADQFKLNRRVDVKRPGLRFRREYGTRHKKKVFGLLEKLSYLCDAAAGKYSGCLMQYKELGAFCEISVDRSGESVTFQLPCDILMTSGKPLKRFASVDEVMETEKQEVPNIYPIKPTLDLQKYDDPILSDDENLLPCDGQHLHTLFIAHKSCGYWFPKQLLAKAIGTSFAFTALAARRKFGIDVKELPEPIAIQCMYMGMKSFNFLTYQLNTLDLNDNNGVKNQVWVDEEADLYESVSEKTLISNFNPSVFPKMLALHLNGLHPSSL